MPIVKRNVKAVQIRLPALGNVGHKLLGCFADFFSGNHDGCTVGIVCAHKVHLMAKHSLRPYPNVSLDVFHDVANVKMSIGIGQGGGDKQLTNRHGKLLFF